MAKEQSIWAEKLTFKDQVKVIKGLLPFAKPYKWYFFSAIIAIGVVSAINVLLPRILQEFMNKYLVHLDTKFQVLIILQRFTLGFHSLKPCSNSRKNTYMDLVGRMQKLIHVNNFTGIFIRLGCGTLTKTQPDQSCHG